MDYFIAGCGWVCTRLAARLMDSGHRVWATCTSESKARQLEKSGISAMVVDFDQPDVDVKLERTTFDVAVISIPITRKDTMEVVRQRFGRLSTFLNNLSIHQSFFFGSVGIYPAVSGTITESTFPDEQLDQLLLMGEQTLRSVYPDLNVLRLGGLFGYDRVMAKYFEGKVCSIGYQTANFVHVDDICNIVTTMVDAGSQRKTYNVVAPEHPLKKDVIAASAAKHGYGMPISFTDAEQMVKMVSPARLIEELTYTFAYPSPLGF